jgi:hypothetical protein
VGEQLRLENEDMPVAKGKNEGSSYIERREQGNEEVLGANGAVSLHYTLQHYLEF